MGVTEPPEGNRTCCGGVGGPGSHRVCSTVTRRGHLFVTCQTGQNKREEERRPLRCRDREELSLLCPAGRSRRQGILRRDPGGKVPSSRTYGRGFTLSGCQSRRDFQTVRGQRRSGARRAHHPRTGRRSQGPPTLACWFTTTQAAGWLRHAARGSCWVQSDTEYTSNSHGCATASPPAQPRRRLRRCRVGVLSSHCVCTYAGGRMRGRDVRETKPTKWLPVTACVGGARGRMYRARLFASVCDGLVVKEIGVWGTRLVPDALQ